MLVEPTRFGLHDGIPGLEDPRVHDPAHRLAGGRLDRIPQVVGLGVGVRVGAEVVAHAGPEAVDAEVLLEHPQQGATLLIGQHVEHAFAVGR